MIMLCLVSSRTGLRKTDLEGIFDNMTGIEPWDDDDFELICTILGDHLIRGDEGQWNIDNRYLPEMFSGYFSSDNEDDKESIEELKHAIVTVLEEDDSDFAARELMHYCHLAQAPDRAAEAIADSADEDAPDNRKIEHYITGLREILYKEVNKIPPEESFLAKILYRTEGEDESVTETVYSTIVKAVDVLRNSSITSSEFRQFFQIDE